MQTTITEGTHSPAQHDQDDDLAAHHDLILSLEMTPMPPNEHDDPWAHTSTEWPNREPADYPTETNR